MSTKIKFVNPRGATTCTCTSAYISVVPYQRLSDLIVIQRSLHVYRHEVIIICGYQT